MSIYSSLSTLCTENLTDEQANLKIQSLIREHGKIKTQQTQKFTLRERCSFSHVLAESSKQDILLLLTTYKIDKSTFLMLRKYCFGNFCEACVHFYGETVSFFEGAPDLYDREAKIPTQSGRANLIKQQIATQNNRQISATHSIGTQTGHNFTQSDNNLTISRLNDSQSRSSALSQTNDSEHITQDDVKEERRIFMMLYKLKDDQNDIEFRTSQIDAKSVYQTKSIHVTSNSTTTSLYNSILLFYLSPRYTHFTLNFYTFFPILYIIEFFHDQCYPLVSSIIFLRAQGKNLNQLKELVINWYILFKTKNRSDTALNGSVKTELEAKRLKKAGSEFSGDKWNPKDLERLFSESTGNSEIPDAALSIFSKGIQIQLLHKFYLLDTILKYNLQNCECAMHFDKFNCENSAITNSFEHLSSNEKSCTTVGLWVQYHRYKLLNPNCSMQDFFESTGFKAFLSIDQRQANTLKRMPKCSRNCTFYFDLTILQNVDCHVIDRILRNEGKNLKSQQVIGIIRSIIHYDRFDLQIAITLLNWLEKNRGSSEDLLIREKVDFLLKYMRMHPIHHPASLFVPDYTPFIEADNEFEQMVFDNLLIGTKYHSATFQYFHGRSFYEQFYMDFSSTQSGNTQRELLQLLDNPIATLYTLQKHDCPIGVFIYFMGLCVRNHSENSQDKNEIPSKTSSYRSKAQESVSSSGNNSKRNSLQCTPDFKTPKSSQTIFYTFYLFMEKALIRELQKMESIQSVVCANLNSGSGQKYDTASHENSTISEKYFSMFSHIISKKHPYLPNSAIFAFFQLLKEYFSYIPEDLLETHFNLSNLLNSNRNGSLGEWTRQVAVWAISRGYITEDSVSVQGNRESVENIHLSYFNMNPTFLLSENNVQISPFLKQNDVSMATVDDRLQNEKSELKMPSMSSAQEYFKWVVEEIVTSGLTKTSCDEPSKLSRSVVNNRSGFNEQNSNQSTTQLPLNMFVIQSVMQFIPISFIRTDYRQLVEIFCTSGFRVNSNSRLMEILNQSDGFKRISANEERKSIDSCLSSSENVKKFDLVCKKCTLHPHGAKSDKSTLSDSDKSKNNDLNDKFLNILKEISVLYLSSHLQFTFSVFSHKIRAQNLTDCEAYTGWMKTANREIDCVWYRWFIFKAQKEKQRRTQHEMGQDEQNPQTFSQKKHHPQLMKFSDDKNTNTTLLFSFMSFFCLKHAKDIFDKIAIIYDLLEHFKLLNFDQEEIDDTYITISSSINTSFIFTWLRFINILPENFQNIADLRKYLIRELKLALNTACDLPHIDVLRIHNFDDTSIAIDIFHTDNNSLTQTDQRNSVSDEQKSLVEYISNIIRENDAEKSDYRRSSRDRASRNDILSRNVNFLSGQPAQAHDHLTSEKGVNQSNSGLYLTKKLQDLLYYNQILVPSVQNTTHLLFQHIMSIYESSLQVCSDNENKSGDLPSRSIADVLNFFLGNFQYIMGKRIPQDLALHWILASNIKYGSNDKLKQKCQISIKAIKSSLLFHDSLLLYTLNHDQSVEELKIKNDIVQHMIRYRDARGLFYWGLLNDKFYLNEFIKTKTRRYEPERSIESTEISKSDTFSIKSTLTPKYYSELFKSDHYQNSVSDLKLQAILLLTNKDNVDEGIDTAEKIVREHAQILSDQKSNQHAAYGKSEPSNLRIIQSGINESKEEKCVKDASLFSKSLVFPTLFLLKARNGDPVESLLFYIRASYSQILLEECLMRAMELFWEREVLPSGPHSCSFLTDDPDDCKGQHTCVRYVPFYDKYLFYEYDHDSCTYKLFLSDTHSFERKDSHKKHSKLSQSSNTVDDLNALFGAHFLLLLQRHPSYHVAPFFTQFIYKIGHKKNKTKSDSPKTRTSRTSRQSSSTAASSDPASYDAVSTEKILFSLLSYMIECNPWYCAYYGYVYCNKSRNMADILQTSGDSTNTEKSKHQIFDYSREQAYDKENIANQKIVKGPKVDASNPTYLFVKHAQTFYTVQAFTQVLLKIGKNAKENITTDEYPELARFKIPIPVTSDNCYTQNKGNTVNLSDISKLKNLAESSVDIVLSNLSSLNQTVTLVTISSFSKTISSFKSLQAPKRLIYTDHQGKCRSFLIKCNDELRKDSRMIGMYKLFYKVEEKRDYNRVNEMVYRKCKNIWDNVEGKQAYSTPYSTRKCTMRSNEQISSTFAHEMASDNMMNGNKCQICQSDSKNCLHSTDSQDFSNSLKQNCTCQSDTSSVLDHNVFDSFENGIDGSLLRHYVVVPLGDKFGMIEWIGNLATIKSIVWEGNKRTIFNAWKKYKKKIEYKEFLKYEKECHSLLKCWFREKYRNTKEYYKNKYNYLNSLAITSAYGYFLGLGDRHLENINILTDSGTIVHIDLNLLFSKGKQLSVPEKVEFRMSKNIVDNLLIGKENGLFKVRFQEMINLIKKKLSMVEAHLLLFVYDPINDLTRPKQTITSLIKKLDRNVDDLIKENMDKKNLSGMYVGWMPFL